MLAVAFCQGHEFRALILLSMWLDHGVCYLGRVALRYEYSMSMYIESVDFFRFDLLIFSF